MNLKSVHRFEKTLCEFKNCKQNFKIFTNWKTGCKKEKHDYEFGKVFANLKKKGHTLENVRGFLKKWKRK